MDRKSSLIIIISSILIGVIIALQIKSKVVTYVPATLASINEFQNEIDSVNQEIEELNRVIEDKEEELDILKSLTDEDGEKDILDLLEEDILKNQMRSGNVAMKGPGIIIEMFDNPTERDLDYDINQDVIHDMDLFKIVNDLRLAGAEGISINGERVLSTSEIKCGGPIVKINGRSSGTPFILKAIGDPKKLMASVNAPGTYGYLLKNVHEKGFNTEREDSLVIPGYSRTYNFRYAKPKGEES